MQTLAEENERFTTELKLPPRRQYAVAVLRERPCVRGDPRAGRFARAGGGGARRREGGGAGRARARGALGGGDGVLEERARRAREALRLRGEMSSGRTTDRERRDRAARAATADRNEMATAIEGFRREREFLRAKLRDAAAREEREMERGPRKAGGRGGASAVDDDDSDEESPGGSAPRNTPARQMDPARARAPRRGLARCIFRRSIFRRRRWCWNPNGDETSSARVFPLREPVRERRARDRRRACRRRRATMLGWWTRSTSCSRKWNTSARGRSARWRRPGRRRVCWRRPTRRWSAGSRANASCRRRAPRRRGTRRKTFREAPSGGSDASDASDEDDSDAWSDDDVGTTPRRRRGVLLLAQSVREAVKEVSFW